MRVQIATEPAKPDVPNEDFVATTTDALVLLDGSGNSGAEAGCSHTVAWYVRHLGSALMAELTTSPAPLTTALDRAITAVRGQHDDTCDLTHPGTPSATVILVREVGPNVEYLVLADSVLLLETTTDVQVITDDREGQIGRRYRAEMDSLPNGSPEHATALRDYIQTMRDHRNQPGGFWVAAANPNAASEALTGSVPADQLRSVAALSDGASRIADRFHLATWPQVLGTLAKEGPSALLHQVREAERSDQSGSRWPRGKTFDDATAAYAAAIGH